MIPSVAVLLLWAMSSADGKDKKEGPGSDVVKSIREGIPVSDPKIVQQDGKPPVIVYPPSRQSKKWIDIGGPKVAVDGGVDWQGKTAYYSLKHVLVVTDANTGKTLWHEDGNEFWDSLTFENLAEDKKPEQWAVVLKKWGDSRYSPFAQCYDLETGKRFALREPTPPGSKHTPRKQWVGTSGIAQQAKYALVGSADEWVKLRKNLFGEKHRYVPEASEIDFTKEMLLVLYDGEGINPSGPFPKLVVENDKELVVRVEVPGFQVTIVDGSYVKLPTTHPYGLVVLPRRTNKPVVLEYTVGGIWGLLELWEQKKLLMLQADHEPGKKDR